MAKASLTLTLTPNYKDGNDALKDDYVRIESLDFISINEFKTQLPNGATNSIEIDLLKHYKPKDILNVLFKDLGIGGLGGRISMRYFDDALISFAKLELIQ